MSRIFLAFVGTVLWGVGVAQVESERPAAQGQAPLQAEPLRVRYPDNVDPDPVYEKRDLYMVKLLELVMAHSGEPYELEPVRMQTINASRISRNLASHHYDVSWMHTNKDRENALRPVRVPLFKGLVGWRLLMVNRKDLPVFEQIHSPEELKRRVAGQGHTWPDTEILRANGYRVETSVHYTSLISMLKGGRIDYFPRSVFEVWEELTAHGIDNSLRVEPHLALVYPSAYYFFVRPEDDRLHEALSRGFAEIRQNGAFDRLFNQFFGGLLERARLGERQLFHLKNPGLEAQLPRDADLWFTPDAPPSPDDPS